MENLITPATLYAYAATAEVLSAFCLSRRGPVVHLDNTSGRDVGGTLPPVMKGDFSCFVLRQARYRPVGRKVRFPPREGGYPAAAFGTGSTPTCLISETLSA